MSDKWRIGYRPIGEASAPVTWLDDLPEMSFSDADTMRKRIQANYLGCLYVVGIPETEKRNDAHKES